MTMISLIRNIRFLEIAVMLLLAPMMVGAVTVEWGVSSVIAEQSDFDGSDWLFTIGRPYFNIKGDVSGLQLILTAMPDSNLENANSFVRAQIGDVVSQEYLNSKGEYFAWAQYNNPSVHTDYQIILDDTEHVYLVFAAEYAAYGTIRYGWLELGRDERGLLKVYSSAWDVDGDSITVGSIPEPMSGVLLMFGLSVLALRRRKFE